MREVKWMVLAGLVGVVLAGGCKTMCSEETVKMMPPEAQKTIDKYAEGGTIGEVKMKTKHGKVLYEAEVKNADGSELEILVNAEGVLYKLEREDPEQE